MAIDVKEYAAFTGVTEDTEEQEVAKTEEGPVVVPGDDQGEGTEPVTGEETGPDGGSVEGE